MGDQTNAVALLDLQSKEVVDSLGGGALKNEVPELIAFVSPLEAFVFGSWNYVRNTSYSSEKKGDYVVSPGVAKMTLEPETKLVQSFFPLEYGVEISEGLALGLQDGSVFLTGVLAVLSYHGASWQPFTCSSRVARVYPDGHIKCLFMQNSFFATSTIQFITLDTSKRYISYAQSREGIQKYTVYDSKTELINSYSFVESIPLKKLTVCNFDFLNSTPVNDTVYLFVAQEPSMEMPIELYQTSPGESNITLVTATEENSGAAVDSSYLSNGLLILVAPDGTGPCLTPQLLYFDGHLSAWSSLCLTIPFPTYDVSLYVQNNSIVILADSSGAQGPTLAYGSFDPSSQKLSRIEWHLLQNTSVLLVPSITFYNDTVLMAVHQDGFVMEYFYLDAEASKTAYSLESSSDLFLLAEASIENVLQWNSTAVAVTGFINVLGTEDELFIPSSSAAFSVYDIQNRRWGCHPLPHRLQNYTLQKVVVDEQFVFLTAVSSITASSGEVHAIFAVWYLED